MLNHLNRTLSANLNRRNLGTLSQHAAQVEFNNVAKTLRIRPDHILITRSDSMRLGVEDPMEPRRYPSFGSSMPSSPPSSGSWPLWLTLAERGAVEAVVEAPALHQETVVVHDQTCRIAGAQGQPKPRQRGAFRVATVPGGGCRGQGAGRWTARTAISPAARPAAGG